MAKIKVTQIGSPIRRTPVQEQNLIGLGLNKMHRSREHADTPEIRGMIKKVAHLLKVEELA
jgi:large subunit ribosomal protein L30